MITQLYMEINIIFRFDNNYLWLYGLAFPNMMQINFYTKRSPF